MKSNGKYQYFMHIISTILQIIISTNSCCIFSARYIFTETLRMAGKMSDVEYSIVDQWYRLLNNEMAEYPTGFDLSADSSALDIQRT